MSTKIDLDVVAATKSAKSLGSAISAVTKNWKAQEVQLKSVGDSLKASEVRYEGLTKSISGVQSKIDILREKQSKLDTTTKEGREAYIKYANQISNSEKQLASLNAQQSRAKEALNYQKSGLAGLQKEYQSINAVAQSYTERLKAEGKDYEANKTKIKSYEDSIENLNKQQKIQTKELEEIASTSGKASDAYRKQEIRVNQTATSMAKAKNEIEKLNKENEKINPSPWTRLRNAITKTHEKAEKTNSVFKSVFSANLLSNAVSGAWSKLTGWIGSAVDEAKEFSLQQQTMTATWNTLTGSASKGKAMVEITNQMAIAAQNSTEMVDALNQKFYAVTDNVSKTKELSKAVLTLQDAFGASDDAIKNFSVQWSQMVGNGKATAQDMLSIQNVFPKFKQELLSYYQQVEGSSKFTMEQMNDLMSDGKVSADVMNKVLVDMSKKYSSATENFSKTIPGMTRIIKSQMPSLLSAISDPLANMANPIIGVMSDWVSSSKTRKAFEKIGKTFATGLNDVIDAFSPKTDNGGFKAANDMVTGIEKVNASLDERNNGTVALTNKLDAGLSQINKWVKSVFSYIKEHAEDIKQVTGDIGTIAKIFGETVWNDFATIVSDIAEMFGLIGDNADKSNTPAGKLKDALHGLAQNETAIKTISHAIVAIATVKGLRSVTNSLQDLAGITISKDSILNALKGDTFGGAFQSLKSAGGFKGLSKLGKLTFTATAAFSAVDIGKNFLKAIESNDVNTKYKGYGSGIGGLVGGAIGVWLGGPAGAAIGIALGEKIGENAGEGIQKGIKKRQSELKKKENKGKNPEKTEKRYGLTELSWETVGYSWEQTKAEFDYYGKQYNDYKDKVNKWFEKQDKIAKKFNDDVVKKLKNLFTIKPMNAKSSKSKKGSNKIDWGFDEWIDPIKKQFNDFATWIKKFKLPKFDIDGWIKDVQKWFKSIKWPKLPSIKMPSLNIADWAEKITKNFNKWMNPIAKKWGSFFDGLKKNSKLKSFLKGTFFKDVFTKIGGFIKDKGEDVAKKWGELWKGINSNKYVKAFKKGEFFKTAISDMSTKISSFKESFSKKWNTLWKDTTSYLKKKWTENNDRVKKGWSDINSGWDKFKTGFKKGWDKFWGGIGTALDKAWKSIKDTAKSGFNTVIDVINGAIGKINSVIKFFGGKDKTLSEVKKLATGTGGKPIQKPTLAMVNDGSDSPETGNKEALWRPATGEFGIFQGRNVKTLLMPGDHIIKASDTRDLMYAHGVKHFAKGTFDIGSFLGNAVNWVKDKASDMKKFFDTATKIIKHPIKYLESMFDLDTLGNLSGAVKTIATGLVDTSVDQVKKWWSAIWDMVSGKLNDSGTGGAASEAVQAAQKYGNGKPYVWGAVGPDSFDCSGLVQYTLKRKYGIDYPHYSGDQYAMTQHISKSQAKPGDLVFWGSGGSAHVGFYNGGNEYYSAQSPSQGIGMNTLDSVVGHGSPMFGRVKGLSQAAIDSEASVKTSDALQKYVKNQLGSGFWNFISKLAQAFGISSYDGDTGGGAATMSMIEAAAKKMKVTLPSGFAEKLMQVIMNESGNRSIIQQIQDINSGGNEARGILQYTPTTFAAYAMPGYTNIMNPYHQLLAFFNNSDWKNSIGWANIWGTTKMEWLNSGPQGHRRFANGGIVGGPETVLVGEGNAPESIIPWDIDKRSRALALIKQTLSKFESENTGAVDKYDYSKKFDELSEKFDILIDLLRMKQEQPIQVSGDVTMDGRKMGTYLNKFIQKAQRTSVTRGRLNVSD